jgi:hypothetical protein
MANTKWARALSVFMALDVLGGCANLPPMIQDHNGVYGLYLPTGQELAAAMMYRQDAKFPIYGGESCILEHNTLNGHVRFLYQNAAYVQMQGWRDMHYVSSSTLPDGQVMGLFIGTVNEKPNTEEMVLFHPHGISFATLGTGGVAYAPAKVTENHVIFKQVDAQDPLLRVYYVQQQQLSMPILKSTVLEREAKIQEREALRIERQKAQQEKLREQEILARQQERSALANRIRSQRQAERAAAIRQQVKLPQSHAQMMVQAISIQGGAIPVQSSVPMGHQNVAPQAVNLQ